MANQVVQTTDPGMSSAVSQFEDKAASFRSQLDQVDSYMQQLEAGWKGNASAAFSQAMNQWQEGFQKVVTALDSVTQGMGSSARAYDQHEDTSTQSAQSFLGGLPGL
jgi:WXG100 family type VII secretion target